MNKKILIIIIVITVISIIMLCVGGYFYWSKKNKAGTNATSIKTLENIGDTTEKITESATKSVLPSLQTNPLENKPDINPADKTNPYKNIKTNPFE